MLERYWPTIEETNNCIKAEAETASEALLLSVHLPPKLAFRNTGNPNEVAAEEHDLLEAFLTDNLPEGTLILPITGKSGAGKSHMIRWLHAQMLRDKRSQKMHVIRIPKSATLKKVVELILEPLIGDPKFDKIIQEFDRSLSAVSPDNAATLFYANLKMALSGLANDTLAQLRDNPNLPNAKSLRSKVDHARKLPILFADSTTEKHFSSAIFAPIISRAVGDPDKDLPTEKLPQFTIDDLILPDTIDLAEASKEVRTYYQTILNRESSGSTRGEAVTILNEVVDEAIRGMFQLGQSIGGVTLEEIILEIRELLMHQGKELVLLVEDFAALSGIQEILLRICIQEAVREGKLVRSPMRTALALTDGYLKGRDTISTRAKREWIVLSEFKDSSQVVDATVDLVGAYLNAARWGYDGIVNLYSQAGVEQGKSLTDWIKPFEDDDKGYETAELLNAFGKNSRQEYLFPFNREAIALLAAKHMTVGGQLEFNPRRVINYIIRDTLLMRPDFEKNRFPGEQFQGARVTADIASWLSQASISSQERGRMESVLCYWGGNPRTIRELRLSESVFKAFGVKSPQDLGEHLPAPLPTVTAREIKVREVKVEPAKKESPPNPRLTLWQTNLEQWASGIEMGQKEANDLRQEIARAVNKWLEGNPSRPKGKPFPYTAVSIPNARGNKQIDPVVCAVSESHHDPTGNARRTLLAFARLLTHDRRLDYDQADEDAVLTANLSEKFGEQYLAHLLAEQDAESAFLIKCAIMQARILGFGPRQIKTPEELRYLLTEEIKAPKPEDTQSSSPISESWQALRAEAASTRAAGLRLLEERLGCFQGTGTTLQALDIVRAWRNFKGTPSAPKETFPGVSQFLARTSETRLKATASQVVSALKTFSDNVVASLGEDFEKEKLLQNFQALLTNLEANGIWPPRYDRAAVKANLTRFQQTAIKDSMETVQKLVKAETVNSMDDLLYHLGRVDFEVVTKTRDFLKFAESFIEDAERQFNSKIRLDEGHDPAVHVQTLKQIFEQTLEDLAFLSEHN